MYQCYYQTDYSNPKTRCLQRQEDCWCSEEHRKAWQEIHYKDMRERRVRQLTPAQLQKRLLHIQIRELRKKWMVAEDLFEKKEIENRAKLIKQKIALLET